ncbi:MAG: ATP-binding protein [Candidatus Peribacteraceae bacterium]|nr:ATP-binding protein [Candidatus Peribacteraceae bacterium]
MRKIDAATVVASGIAIIAILALGTFFYNRSENVLDTMLKDHIRTVVTVASKQIDGDAVERIRDASSVETAEFRSTLEVLNKIRADIPTIRYVYIMRQTEDPNIVTFVVDADAYLTEAELDEDGDGIISEEEAVPLPGEPYNVERVPELQGNAFKRPSVDQELTSDKWGTFLSGYTPIRTSDGRVTGTLGIDMLADEYRQQVRQVFSPIAFVLLLAMAIIVVSVIIVIARQRKMLATKRIEAERMWLAQLTLHRVGNALSIFKFTTEILKEKLRAAGGSKEVRGEIKDLEEGIERLSSILRMVQRAGAIPRRIGRHKKRCAQLRGIIRSAVQKCQKRAVRITCPASVTIAVDENALEGALYEVLANAIQFSKKAVHVSVAQKKTGVEIQVQDSGIGISDEDLPHVFEHFYVGKESWLVNPDAMGLGLYIAKGILQHMGGTIRIETERGKGTTVIIGIPSQKGVCAPGARRRKTKKRQA